MKTVEIIVPCYNEEKCIFLFYEKLKEVFMTLSQYRLILTYIDDGSTDGTMNEIKRLEKTARQEKIQYLSFSRNFGKEAAIYAGLLKSTGDYVTVMDADLQHPPELLKEMLYAIENEGYDCATARRVSRRGELPVRSTLSKCFYHVISKITAINLISGSTDYRLMTRKVVNAILSMPERERFTKGLYAWVGFNNKWIEYENRKRVAGRSKWNMRGLFRYAYSGIISFAITPLRGVIYLGLVITLAAFIYAGYVGIAALYAGEGGRNGYTSIMIAILFIGGVIITILGMIGEYLARIYLEVKKRPIYLEKESNLEGEHGIEEPEKEEYDKKTTN